MTTSHPIASKLAGRLALLLAFAAPLASPARAADDASTPPSMPKHEMGGNDAKPGFFDMSKHGSDKNEQPVPAPGKAAGSTSTDMPVQSH